MIWSLFVMSESCPTYHELQQENEHLRRELTKAFERIAALEAELAARLVTKDSRNSSRPPSSDPPSTPPHRRSLRQQSGRTPGGQPGHQGQGCTMRVRPDHVDRHVPSYCSACGRPVASATVAECGRYQIVDLPPVTVEVTEHRFYRSRCACGALTGSPSPHTGLLYGPGIKSLAAYLSVRHFLPYDRLAEVLHDLFHLSISPGTLVTAVRSMASAGRGAYEAIRQRLLRARCLGSDETGLRVAGKGVWAWTWQSPTETFIGLASSRGQAAVSTFFPDGFSASVLVHDRWAAQLNTPARKHQLCLAHLLRDLQYAMDAEKRALAYRLHRLFLKALGFVRTKARASPRFQQAVSQMHQHVDRLLAQGLPATQPVLGRLIRALRKHRDKLFVFLDEPGVPPTNNASEQAIRNLKVKQKVSTGFRTWAGAEDFVILRSILDTCLKRGQSVFSAFQVMGELCLSTE